MRWLIIILLTMVLLMAGYFAVVGGGQRGQEVTFAGSTSILPFAEMLAEHFNAEQEQYFIDVQGGGSSQGIRLATDGAADVGMASRNLKPDEEKTLDRIVIAQDGLAVVVHADNPVADLSRQQIADIFSGKYDNWRPLGGPDRPIYMITREEGSGTREAFQELVMGKKVRITREAIVQESNGSVKELVKQLPGAIGYMSLGLVNPHGQGESGIKALRVDGVEATRENVQAGSYKLIRPFLFVVRRDQPLDAGARKFVYDFVLQPAGQQMLELEGLIGVGHEGAASQAGESNNDH